MDLTSFDDPQPVVPTDATRMKVRAKGNRLRVRRRLALSAPVALVVAAAIAIPLAVTTSNNRSDIQRIEPITPVTPSETPPGPSVSPNTAVATPSPPVTKLRMDGASPTGDLTYNPYTTPDGTKIFPHGTQGGFGFRDGVPLGDSHWTVVAGPSGFALRVDEFTNTLNGRNLCESMPGAPAQQDEQLAPGQRVEWVMICGIGSGETYAYAPGGIPAVVWVDPRGDSGLAKAWQACYTWYQSDSQDSAVGSGTIHSAAALATQAASLDPEWTDLAQRMTSVASLPLTDNPPSAVAQARTNLTTIKATCASLGLQINGD